MSNTELQFYIFFAGILITGVGAIIASFYILRFIFEWVSDFMSYRKYRREASWQKQQQKKLKK